jgi:hypothetical protein
MVIISDCLIFKKWILIIPGYKWGPAQPVLFLGIAHWVYSNYALGWFDRAKAARGGWDPLVFESGPVRTSGTGTGLDSTMEVQLPLHMIMTEVSEEMTSTNRPDALDEETHALQESDLASALSDYQDKSDVYLVVFGIPSYGSVAYAIIRS